MGKNLRKNVQIISFYRINLPYFIGFSKVGILP
jgi:hypothetical protein